MGIGERSRIIEDHNMDKMRKKIRKQMGKKEVTENMSKLKEVADNLELIVPEKKEKE